MKVLLTNPISLLLDVQAVGSLAIFSNVSIKNSVIMALKSFDFILLAP